MASKAKKLSKQVKANELEVEFEMKTSIIGHIVTTFGMLGGKSEDDMLREYKTFKHTYEKETNRDWTIKEICDFFKNLFKVPNDLCENVVLLTDRDSLYPPTVCPMVDFGEYWKALPTNRDGLEYGLVKHWNDAMITGEPKVNIDLEWLYVMEDDDETSESN